MGDKNGKMHGWNFCSNHKKPIDTNMLKLITSELHPGTATSSSGIQYQYSFKVKKDKNIIQYRS